MRSRAFVIGLTIFCSIMAGFFTRVDSVQRLIVGYSGISVDISPLSGEEVAKTAENIFKIEPVIAAKLKIFCCRNSRARMRDLTPSVYRIALANLI